MPSYTQVLSPRQVPLDPVRILSIDESDHSIADFFGWEPVHVDEHVEARSAVVHAYMYHEWGAVEAFNALVQHGLFGDVETFMDTYSAGVEALAARMPSSPTELPPAAPGARSEPPEYLLDVLAPVRERRAVA